MTFVSEQLVLWGGGSAVKIMVEIQCIFLKMPLTHLGWVLRTCCCNCIWFLCILAGPVVIWLLIFWNSDSCFASWPPDTFLFPKGRLRDWLDFSWCLSLQVLVLSLVWVSFFKSGHIVYLIFLKIFFNQCVAGEKSSHFSEGLCLLPHRQTFFLCNPLICMAMTFVVPVISSDNGRACRADLKTYSLIMCC